MKQAQILSKTEFNRASTDIETHMTKSNERNHIVIKHNH
jgi:hypothetical protein